MAEPDFARRVRSRRTAAALTQRQLAEQSGVKQPLIAAIERGTRAPSASVRDALEQALQVRPSQLLHAFRDQVSAALQAAGVGQVQVFGSVARGEDRPDSDLDLLVEFPKGSDIVTLLSLEDALADILTVPVDVVSAGGAGRVLDRARAEAVPL